MAGELLAPLRLPAPRTRQQHEPQHRQERGRPDDGKNAQHAHNPDEGHGALDGV